MTIKSRRNVYHVMAPILAVSKLAAVCNVRRIRGNNAAYSYTRSVFMTVIQAAILIVCMLHLGFVPYAVIYLEQLEPGMQSINSSAIHQLGGDLTSQKFITKMANIVLLSVTAILARLANTVQLPKILPSLMEDIHKFDKMASRSNNDFAWIFGLSVVLVLISWPYQFYSILLVTTDNWAAFLMFYINLYNNFSCISCEFQFVSLCWLIQSRFRGILDELKGILVKNIMDFDGSMMTKLKRLEKSNKLLTEICVKMNSLYNFQLFIILSGLTLNTLFSFYFAIFGGYEKHSNKTSISFQKISNIVNDVLWSFYYFARFFFICEVGGVVADKGNEPKRIISEILLKPYSEEIKQKLWEYLVYVKMHKIEFSACGFFKVNIALITSVCIGILWSTKETIEKTVVLFSGFALFRGIGLFS